MKTNKMLILMVLFLLAHSVQGQDEPEGREGLVEEMLVLSNVDSRLELMALRILVVARQGIMEGPMPDETSAAAFEILERNLDPQSIYTDVVGYFEHAPLDTV